MKSMLLARNVTAFVNAFGIEDPDFVLTLATLPWQSEDERNAFINEIVSINNGELVKQTTEQEF